VGSDSSGPNTTDGAGAFSEPYSFASPVAAGQATTIAILGDMGTVMPLGFAVAEKLAAVQDALGLDMGMVVGDLAYAGIDTAFPRINVSKDDEFEWIWDLWQIQNQPVAATRPWMVGIGNHEAWYNWTAVRRHIAASFGEFGGGGVCLLLWAHILLWVGPLLSSTGDESLPHAERANGGCGAALLVVPRHGPRPLRPPLHRVRHGARVPTARLVFPGPRAGSVPGAPGGAAVARREYFVMRGVSVFVRGGGAGGCWSRVVFRMLDSLVGSTTVIHSTLGP
jgi:hypothetical protein